MHIGHIAMYAVDLERAKTFFEMYFNAVSGPMYYNKTTGFRSYFLSFPQGPQLEIMNKSAMANSEKDLARTGFAHIAFCVGSREKVDEMTKRLKANGFIVVSGPRTTGDSYYESCVWDAEKNQIEITV